MREGGREERREGGRREREGREGHEGGKGGRALPLVVGGKCGTTA